MPYQTDERIKSYLDTNQLHREQMCRAILAIDKRFSDVRPRHPRGGRDGGRDIEGVFRETQLAFGAVGFVNQANDSEVQKKTIRSKFKEDLASALNSDQNPAVFIFFTNINMTIGEKNDLVESGRRSGLNHCEIFDRERLRIALDSPDGFAIRFQFLSISLSEEEQASFFARWGDDIQAVISTGFQRIEDTLNRLMFLQEASDTISHLTLTIQLDREYSAEEIGHFRLFCSLHLKEPKHGIIGLLFGSSDKAGRMRGDLQDFIADEPGIKHGISGGQWEQHIPAYESGPASAEEDDGSESYLDHTKVGSSSAIGMSKVEFISISYSKDSFIRLEPGLSLRDIDDSMFILLLNKTLAEKVGAIHLYSNGYKIQEISQHELICDTPHRNIVIPAAFSEDELKDQWVYIRPPKYSCFHVRFFEETPKRLFVSRQTPNSLESRNKHQSN